MPRIDPVLPSNLKLFDHAEDWWHNATLSTGADSWHEIAQGYRIAANTLVDHAVASRVALDWVAFPIAFLYRHYVELSLKAILIDAGNLLDRPQDPGNSHRLLDLWGKLRPLLEEISPGENPDFLDRSGGLIGEFESLDPGSYAFRYPVDTAGRPSLPADTGINIRQMKAVMAELAILFDGAGAMISEYEGYRGEM